MNPSPVMYVPSGGSLDKRIEYVDCDEDTFLEVASTVFKHLPLVNRPEVILPILGWFFATPMKPRFMEKVGTFLSLFVWGTRGSGKSMCIVTSCGDVRCPRRRAYSATETEFALLKLLSSTRSVPVFIDEYKPTTSAERAPTRCTATCRRLVPGRGRGAQSPTSKA
ncbi:MAG: hypothetical protein IPJ56_09120 [Gemmatimonadetes bacterium]|nr:hypothetical protein [Gemmatimonadota bacterium]